MDIEIRRRRALGQAVSREIGATLGVDVANELPCEIIATGLRHLVVPIDDDDALSRFTPQRLVAEKLGAAYGVDTIALLAEHGVHDGIRLRDLCAPIGDVEEPASGTTAAVATDFVARHCERHRLVIRQGEDMGRPSLLRTRLRKEDVVEVSKEARPILIGRLH